MPVYLFRCPDCGKERSVVKSITLRDTPELCHHSLNATSETSWPFTYDRGVAFRMDRVPTPASFIVTGFNAKNGYSK